MYVSVKCVCVFECVYVSVWMCVYGCVNLTNHTQKQSMLAHKLQINRGLFCCKPAHTGFGLIRAASASIAQSCSIQLPSCLRVYHLGSLLLLDDSMIILEYNYNLLLVVAITGNCWKACCAVLPYRSMHFFDLP